METTRSSNYSDFFLLKNNKIKKVAGNSSYSSNKLFRSTAINSTRNIT